MIHIKSGPLSATVKKKRRQITTTINGNMQHCCILKRSEIQSKNSPAVKKVCGPQEGQCEKRCEIQGGGQEWL